MAAHGKTDAPTEAEIDAQIEQMRERAYLTSAAGARDSETAAGPWFDAKGEPAEPFADDVEWDARARFDLRRWGLPIPAHYALLEERILFAHSDSGATVRVDMTAASAVKMMFRGGEDTVTDPATIRAMADAFDRIARANGV